MYKTLSLNITIFYAAIALAQISDNFSNEFSDQWEGDREDFVVNDDFILQLNAADAGTSELMRTTTFSQQQLWEIFIRLDFAPSTANSVVILLATNDDSSESFGLQLGESGSEDVWRFFKRSEGEIISLTAGTDIFGDGFDGILRMEYANKLWLLSAVINGQSNVILSFEDTFDPSLYTKFGFRCIYTSTRSDKFFFDDVKVMPNENFMDSNAPVLQSVQVIDDSTLILSFNEVIEVAEVSISNFIINDESPKLVNPQSSSVEVTSQSNFRPDDSNVLVISQLADLAGNLLDTILTFEFIPTISLEPFDILITELMIDPTPGVGLPEEEYIEIYNNTEQPIELSSVQLRWRDDNLLFPSTRLAPKSYAILVAPQHVELFESFGQVVALESFPSLRNGFDMVELRESDGSFLHAIHYNLSWYGDGSRNDGGYSLELRDVNKPCYLEEGWGASQALIGGSPGRQNEIEVVENDLLLLATFVDSNAVAVSYNRLISEIDQIDVKITGSAATILEIDLTTPFDRVVIHLDHVIDETAAMVIEISDCTGNERIDTIQLVLPQEPEAGDLLINEVLFSAPIAAADYIEIVNVSNKYLSLDNVFVANFFEGNQVNELVVNTTIGPSEYLVITEDPSTIKNQFPIHNPASIFLQPIPSLNNDEGNVTLYTQVDGRAIMLDAFDYSEDLHDRRLDNIRGIALERISLESPTQSAFNWYSAASTISFGTPGLPNSQRQVEKSSGDFTLRSETFSPDGDGFEDLLFIDYSLTQADFLANVEVFSVRGVSVYKEDNILLGQTGFIHWDGRSGAGDALKVGRYLVRVEWFSPAGLVEETILSCVLAY